MTIPVTSVVNVSIAVGAVFPSRQGFGVLNIVTDEAGEVTAPDATSRIKSYANMTEVVVDYLAATEANKAATAYFSQQPKPTELKISFRDSGETITEALDLIEAVDSDWYGLSFTKTVRDLVVINTEAAVVAAAAWCEARIKVFFNTGNVANILLAGTTTDIVSLLQAADYRRTISTYSSTAAEYPSASLAGRAFTVNFDNADSTITLKFKQLPGITVETLNTTQFTALSNKNGNALISVGGNNMFSESFMASGVFFDEVHGIDWLLNAIETNIFGYLLTRPTKVPYTDKGTSAIEQQLIKALDQAVANGLIAPGETIDGVFLSRGYSTSLVAVADVSQSDKDARAYNGVSFVAIGAGAIHSVQVNGIFER